MNNIIKRKWNQNSMVIIEDLQGMAFQAESGGHTFQISGIDGEGNAVALSGTPAGVMLRADGQDVALTCSVSGGVVSATLPANAYSVPGRFGLTIFLTSDGQKTAIYAAVGTVGKTSSGTVAPPAGSDVVDLVNAIAAAVATIPASYTDLMAAMAPTYSSSGLYAVGSYAWYNGKLYRCTTAITSGETWTSGHWTLANLGSDLVDLKSALKVEDGNVKGLATSLEAKKIKNFLSYINLAGKVYAGYKVYTITGNSIVANIADSTDSNQLEPNCVLDAGTYTISTQNAVRIQIYFDGSLEYDVTTDHYTFTLSATKNVQVKFLGGSYPLTVGYAQIELGNAVTSFVHPDNSVYYTNYYSDTINKLITNGRTIAVSTRITEPATNQGTVESGVLNANGTIATGTGYRSTLSVTPGSLIYFKGACYNASFPAVIMKYNGNQVSSMFRQAGQYYGNFVVPSYVDTIVINSNANTVIAAIVSDTGSVKILSSKQYVDEKLDGYSVLNGKELVWFGTSIPAGGYIGADITRNYPTFIANKYGCTVHNEAVGSSCAHCKELNMISEANPYGFNPNFELSSRCLSNTTEEMQWIIDNFSASFWTNKPASLTDELKAQILSFSYQTKLNKYLTENTFPDLFVFDHGYNDYVSNVDNYTGHEYEPYTLQGALNFLFREIYSYNPEAKILMIGNYKWQTRSGLVVQAQEAVAQRWDIPIFENWHHTGLSDEKVYCDFTWVNNGGTWTKQSGASHLATLTSILLPDGVHPHSRPDNLMINRMANAIGEWMKVNATFDE